LSLGSVPSGFALTLDRSWTTDELVDQGTYSSSELQGWGYLGGYEREFERDNESDPVKISSDAGAYATSQGVARAFQRNVTLCQNDGWDLIDANVGLGSESMLCARDVSFRGYEARVHFVIWYRGRVKNSIAVTALLGKSTPDLALRLARRQAANY
jgi:hypothetical protein